MHAQVTSLQPPRRAAGRTAGAALALARKAMECTYPELCVLLLLLRRLRVPLQLAPLTVLALEYSVALVCREAGAGVASHVRLADVNLDVPIADSGALRL